MLSEVAKKKGIQTTTERRRVTNDPFKVWGGESPQFETKKRGQKKEERAAHRSHQKHGKNG